MSGIIGAAVRESVLLHFCAIRDAQRNSHDLCEFSLFSLVSYKKCGIIKTDEPRTLDFSGVRGFLVTNVCIVQRSAA